MIKSAKAENFKTTKAELKRRAALEFRRTTPVTKGQDQNGQQVHISTCFGIEGAIQSYRQLDTKAAQQSLQIRAQPEATPEIAVMNSMMVSQPASQAGNSPRTA